jgi:hypothetical protein
MLDSTKQFLPKRGSLPVGECPNRLGSKVWALDRLQPVEGVVEPVEGYYLFSNRLENRFQATGYTDLVATGWNSPPTG